MKKILGLNVKKILKKTTQKLFIQEKQGSKVIKHHIRVSVVSQKAEFQKFWILENIVSFPDI